MTGDACFADVGAKGASCFFFAGALVAFAGVFFFASASFGFVVAFTVTFLDPVAVFFTSATTGIAPSSSVITFLGRPRFLAAGGSTVVVEDIASCQLTRFLSKKYKNEMAVSAATRERRFKRVDGLPGSESEILGE